MNSKFIGYQCSLCGAEYVPGEVTYVCPMDGGNLDVHLDYDHIRNSQAQKDILTSTEPSLWRYMPLLPVGDPGGIGTPLRAAGHTPVFSPARLAEEIGLRQLWVKDESRNPTASFKDRASALVVVRAQQIGAEVVVTASTGNAGAALAGMSAAVGQKAVIFAPKTAPPAKVAQLLVYGAQVLLVDGTYDDAFDLTIQAAQEFGWYCRNTGYNPFTAEGKKTAAFEIWEWMQSGTSADGRSGMGFSINPARLAIFVSVGDGNIISGIHKGFKDLVALGWIGESPRIFGVQTAGSAAVANAYNSGSEQITPVSASTLADSISVDLPRDGIRAVRAARQTGGSYIVVSDEDILSAIAALGKVGIFAEPAGAASYAGLVRAVEAGFISPEDPVLVINTGSGLKDTRAAVQAVPEALIIEPNIDSLRRMIK
jgi:threonine synthase